MATAVSASFFNKRSFPVHTEISPFFAENAHENGFVSPLDTIVPQSQFIALDYKNQSVLRPLHRRSHSTVVPHSAPIFEIEEEMNKGKESKNLFSRTRLLSGHIRLPRLRKGSSISKMNNPPDGTVLRGRSQSFKVQVESNSNSNTNGNGNGNENSGGRLKKLKRRFSGSFRKLTRTESHSPSGLLASKGSPYTSSGFPALKEDSREPIDPSDTISGEY